MPIFSFRREAIRCYVPGQMSAQGIHFEMRAEVFRAARLCAPGMAHLGPVTFQEDASNPLAMIRWRESVFQAALAPVASRALEAARLGVRELVDIDRSCERLFPAPLREASRRAGCRLASARSAPMGETTLARFLEKIAAGDCPGHLAVVFAARAAVFHFPVPVVLAGLVFVEMRGLRLDRLWTVIEEAVPSRTRRELVA